MFVVVGLGNPGEEYAHTRHNTGFDVVDMIADQAGAHYWKTECGALTAQGTIGSEDVVFVKPQSFMNTSGGPVGLVCRTYNVAPDHLIVVHDDLDIEPGSIRVRFGGGHAGHNGLRSIIDKLGTREWYRVRVGMGHPEPHRSIVDYVLGHPRGEMADQCEKGREMACEAVPFLIAHGLNETQQRFN
ncbi:MAG: aminoacyl-tRNA hydrolase [Eggerthellaceae bacterium]|jgi:PTH1 family peptidyl-tRNA hydrolase|nr:aminoacyl-tRNA hydrolase [Eggerthellaceae bacterium]MCH4221553.1 aminoacyl-tRNA hydrolase [Eggerthellaceae bacterium]